MGQRKIWSGIRLRAAVPMTAFKRKNPLQWRHCDKTKDYSLTMKLDTQFPVNGWGRERMDGTDYRRAGRCVGKASSWPKNITPHPPSNPRGLKRQLRNWPQAKGTRWIPQVRPSWHKLRRHSSQFPSLPLSKRQQASLWTSCSSIKSSSVLQNKCLCPKDSKKLLKISSFFFLSNTQSH